jgi:putative PEP-CTERM system TPR-repeat lipoprotein
MPPLSPKLLALALLLSLAGPVAADDAQASRFYEDALRRYQARDLDGAAVQLRNALQRDRKLMPAHLLLGKVELENSVPGAAEAAFQEALRLGASRSEVVVPLARAMLAQGKQAYLLGDPELQASGLPAAVQASLILVRAGAQADLGDDRAALASIQQARSLAPQSAESWIVEVPVRIRAGAPREALAAAEQALRLAPRNADALYQHGAALHVNGRLREAIQAYGKTLELDPHHLDALLARAGLAVDSEQFDAAKRDLDQVHKRYPKDPRADYLSGLIAERRGDRAASQAAMRRVADLLGGVPMETLRYRPQFLLLGGLAFAAVGEPQKSRPYLELLHKQQPRTPATKLLAQQMFDSNEVENGVSLLEDYLLANPNDLQALSLLATGHSKAGRQAKAIQTINRALAVRDDPSLRRVLGSSLLRAGEFASAQDELETAWRKAPTQVSTGVALTMVYLRTGQAQRALATAKAVLALEPESPRLLHLIGLAQAAAGDAKSARASFEKALQLDRSLIEPQLSLARLDARGGRVDAAVDRLQRVHERNPQVLEPMMELASVLARANRLDDAERWLEKATSAAAPRENRPGLALADLQLARQQPAKALETIKTLLVRQPEEPSLLLRQGRALLAAGDANAARAPLLTASRRVAASAPELIEIGSLQLDSGDFANARYSLGKAVEAQPDQPRALVLLARLELARNDPAAAAVHVQQLERQHPRELGTHLAVADLALARRQPQVAGSALRRAHELAPSAITANRLFSFLAQHDSPRAAQQFADSWLRRQPNDAGMLHRLARLQREQQQWPQARASYEQLLRIQPKDAAAMNNLALVLDRQGDRKAALAWAEKAVAAAPGEAVAIDTLAWLLHGAGQHDRALGLLRDARLRAPDHAEIRYHLAAVLATLGRKAEARAELDAALANPIALESRKEALALAGTLK